MNNNQIIEDFFDFLHDNNYKGNTIDAYYFAINNFLDYLEKLDLRIEETTNKIFNEYVNNLKNQGLAEQTINSKIYGIKKLFEFINRKYDLNINLKYKVIKVRTRKSIKPIDIKKLIREINKNQKSKSKERDQLIFNMLYYTGIGIQELISLKSLNIKDDNLLLKNKQIRLNSDLLLEIQNYINTNRIVEDEYLFTNISPAQNNIKNKKHLTAKTIEDLFNNYTKNFDKKHSLRDLRSSYIINSKNNKVTIKKIKTYSLVKLNTDYIKYLNSTS